MNSFDCAVERSETFFFCNSAYNPASFKNICGRAIRTPVKFPSAILATVIPLTTCTAETVNCLRVPDGAVLTLINRASASSSLFMIIISFSFIDPNVFPAHFTTPEAMLNESEGLIPLIGTPCSTKSPLKLTPVPKTPSQSWWTDIMSSRPYFVTVVTDLVSELSPFIFICSPLINVPDTCSNFLAVWPPPADIANPVAPLLNPSIKLPSGNSALDTATLNVNSVYNWMSYT